MSVLHAMLQAMLRACSEHAPSNAPSNPRSTAYGNAHSYAPSNAPSYAPSNARTLRTNELTNVLLTLIESLTKRFARENDPQISSDFTANTATEEHEYRVAFAVIRHQVHYGHLTAAGLLDAHRRLQVFAFATTLPKDLLAECRLFLGHIESELVARQRDQLARGGSS